MPSATTNDSLATQQQQIVVWLDADPVAAIDRVARASDIYDLLRARASSGDTRAMAALVTMLNRCSAYWPSSGSSDILASQFKDAPAGSSQRYFRETAAKLLETYCDFPFDRREGIEQSQMFAERLRDAGKAGDLTGEAWRPSAEAADAILEKSVSEAMDPWVVERALNSFATSRTQLARSVDLEAFPSAGNLPLLGQDEMIRIKLAAARWEGCARGAPCGADQHWELDQCFMLGNCGIGLSVQAFIQQRDLSGREFDLMQRYLEALHRHLQRQRP